MNIQEEDTLPVLELHTWNFLMSRRVYVPLLLIKVDMQNTQNVF